MVKGVGGGGLSEVVTMNIFNEYVTEFVRVLSRGTQLTL